MVPHRIIVGLRAEYAPGQSWRWLLGSWQEELVLWSQHHQTLQQVLLGGQPGVVGPRLAWELQLYLPLHLGKNVLVGRASVGF